MFKCPPGSKPAGVGCIDRHPVTITISSCSALRRAVRFYRARVGFWLERMGTGSPVTLARHVRSCPRYLAHVLRRKAYALRRMFPKWYAYQYDWRSWLPANWVALARCETGLNFEHSNSSYTSAFGISWREYDADAAYNGAPPWRVRHTPRDQYRAALGHYARFGDGWGCPGP